MKKYPLMRFVFVLMLPVFFAILIGCTKKIAPPPVKHEKHTRVERTQPQTAPASLRDHTQRQYTVLGQTYTPLLTHKGYAEEGIASWYGPKFHGRKTSNGEIFNMYEMTAAHRVLPMNTKVKVTNLENGKVVNLRINDRGPFAKDRIIDLSFAAAREMDMIGPGTARVRVEAIGSIPKSQMLGNYYVQVGSFSSRENASRLLQKMKQNGYPESRMQEFFRNNKSLWRVQAGRFSNLQDAENVHSKLLEEMPGAFIIAD